ncbi:MAG: beta-phosphoglucomutase family hydrolase [Candidatus Omnitrophota bacterium]
MKFKGAIFDLDGVIVDTVPLHFKAWKRMFNEYGKSFDFDEYKNKVDGIPRIDGARAVLSNLSEQELDQAAAKKQDYFLEFLDIEEIKVYQSTAALTRELRDAGVKRSVISSSKNCRQILERVNLIDLYDVIITGNDIKKGKPEPDVFLLAAEKLGLEPKECVVFEDAVLGVEAAKRANMKCVGIDRYNSPQRLNKADLIVNDLSEITIEKINTLF